MFFTATLVLTGAVGFILILAALYDDYKHPVHRYEGWK